MQTYHFQDIQKQTTTDYIILICDFGNNQEQAGAELCQAQDSLG